MESLILQFFILMIKENMTLSGSHVTIGDTKNQSPQVLITKIKFTRVMIQYPFSQMFFSCRCEYGKGQEKSLSFSLDYALQTEICKTDMVRPLTFCWSVVGYPISQLQSPGRVERSSLSLSHPHHQKLCRKKHVFPFTLFSFTLYSLAAL